MPTKNIGTEVALVLDVITGNLQYQDAAGMTRTLKGTTDAIGRAIQMFQIDWTPAETAGNVTLAQDAPVVGVLPTDQMVMVIPPAAMTTGLGMSFSPIVTADLVPVLFANRTALAATAPTGLYTFLVLR